MNSLISLDYAWRNAIFQNREFWDHNVADPVNPLFGLLLLGVAIWWARIDRKAAGQFLVRSLLAVLVVFIVIRLAKGKIWPAYEDFPSGHMGLCASILTSLAMLNLRWLWLLVVVVAYAWLMVALRFHVWIDFMGAILVAVPVTWLAHHLNSQQVQKSSRETTVSSSTS